MEDPPPARRVTLEEAHYSRGGSWTLDLTSGPSAAVLLRSTAAAVGDMGATGARGGAASPSRALKPRSPPPGPGPGVMPQCAPGPGPGQQRPGPGVTPGERLRVTTPSSSTALWVIDSQPPEPRAVSPRRRPARRAPAPPHPAPGPRHPESPARPAPLQVGAQGPVTPGGRIPAVPSHPRPPVPAQGRQALTQ